MKNIMRIALPLTLWVIGFSAVYALQGFTCSRHWPAGMDGRMALVTAAALFAVVQAMVLAAFASRPAPMPFVQRTSTILAAAALAAAVWTSLPVLTLTICS